MQFPVAAFLQGNEIVIILIVVLVLFGASAIPKLARALGKAKGEFNTAKKEFDDEVQKGEEESATSDAESNSANDTESKSANDDSKP